MDEEEIEGDEPIKNEGREKRVEKYMEIILYNIINENKLCWTD